MSITTSTNAIPSFSLLYFDISIKSTSHWSSLLRAMNAFSWNIPKHLFVDCGFFDLQLYFLILYLLKTYFPSCLYKFSGPRNFQHWQDHSLSLLNNLPKTCWLFKSRRWNEETHAYSFFFYTICILQDICHEKKKQIFIILLLLKKQILFLQPLCLKGKSTNTSLRTFIVIWSLALFLFLQGRCPSYSTNLLKDGCFWLRSFWQMFDRYSHQKGTFRHLSWFLNELVRFEAEGWTKWLVHTFLRIFWSVKNLLFPPFYF